MPGSSKNPYFYEPVVTFLPLCLLFGLSISDIWTWHDFTFLVTNIETLCDTLKQTPASGWLSTCPNWITVFQGQGFSWCHTFQLSLFLCYCAGSISFAFDVLDNECPINMSFLPWCLQLKEKSCFSAVIYRKQHKDLKCKSAITSIKLYPGKRNIKKGEIIR